MWTKAKTRLIEGETGPKSVLKKYKPLQEDFREGMEMNSSNRLSTAQEISLSLSKEDASQVVQG